MRKRLPSQRLSPLIQGICALIFGCFGVQAEIHTDGTLGPAQRLQGPDFQIPENLGSRAGANLFHSFRTFDVYQGESATFTGSADIANVVSRVTGGEGSSIDGVLRSEIGTADFYFINPAGVTFGPNAKVDVPASFHVSTADELKFSDGQAFSANDPEASSLSIARPEAFGFGGGRSARITVDRSELVMAPTSTLNLVGGDLKLQGTEVNSEAGEVRLVARGDRAGEEPVSGEVGAEFRSGRLEITGSNIGISGNGGGYLGLAANTAVLSESQLVNTNNGSEAATQGTDIQVGKMQMSGGSIQNITVGGGAAGPLNVRVRGKLELASGALLQNATVGTAQAADVAVTAGELLIADGGGILNWTLSTGKAGSVFVDAGRLMIDGRGSESFTGIASQAISGSEGDAGEVQVQVKGRLDLVDGAVISSDTFAAGNAGTVSVKAGQLAADGQGSLLLTGIASISAPGSEGDAGKVQVEVDGQLELVNGAVISSDTIGAGNAGTVSVKTGQLTIDRQGSASVTRIASHANPGSEGDAGEVRVEVEDKLELVNGAEISSGTSAKGNAGSVFVEAGQMTIDGHGSGLFTGIGSQANLDSEGNAGEVQVQVKGDLDLVNGGLISGNSFKGRGGTVNVEARQLTIDGEGSEFLTGITSQANAGSEGVAGDVKVRVNGELNLVNGAVISSDTFSRGNAGSVRVEAGRLTADGQGSNFFTGIASQANPGSEGDAGEVRVEVKGHLGLASGALISSNTFATGHAGNVSVKAGQLTVDEKGRGFLTGIASFSGQGSEGDAGRVQVEVADQLDLVNAGVITTGTFGRGDAGTVKVTAGQLTVDGRGSEFLTGIASRANPGSQGSTGDVVIEAGQLRLLNGGEISIEAGNTLREENLAEIDSGRIRIDAQDIELSEGALITAKSTSNVPAAAIDITARRGMKVTGSSRVTTEATRADGGPIEITGGSILLQNGLITTSAEEKGDGGDIRIRSDALIMDTGFIQANTGAPGASGGDILVDTPQLVVTFGRLEVGGEQRQVFEPDSGLNVIQAAAPDGVSGNVQVTTPEVDVTGALFAMETGFGGVAAVGENPCKVAPGAQPSSLTRGGHGGVPAGASETLSLPWARRIERHTDGERSGGWFPGAATDIGDSDRQAGRRDPRCR